MDRKCKHKNKRDYKRLLIAKSLLSFMFKKNCKNVF